MTYFFEAVGGALALIGYGVIVIAVSGCTLGLVAGVAYTVARYVIQALQ